MIGRTLKHYTVESLLGHGGMGSVYRARDTKLNRAVALKVLKSELTSDAERRRRFVREAQAAAAVTHPSIAQIYDIDEDAGTTFIAMELVEGRSVRQILTDGPLDLLAAIDIGTQVADALGRAHEAGIVHRDIKSDNVMVTPDGHAKLLDFGLAKLVEPDALDETQISDPSQRPTMGISAAQTQAGMVMGTLHYMSPEQARGRPVDHRTDLFSLGVMMYEMATGRLPFMGQSPVDTMHAIAFEDVRPVTEIRPGLPPALQRIVGRCLRKKPEERYADARALLADLRALRTDAASGRIRALPLGERLRDRLEEFRRIRAGGLAWIVFLGAGTLLVVVLLLRSDISLAALVFWGIVGLLVWRRLRNRRHRLAAGFVARMRKLPSVRVVVLRENTFTVIVDRAQAGLYPHVQQLVETLNRKLYFGDPFSVSVRDDLAPAQIRALLQQTGVLHVRPDVLAQESASGLPSSATGSGSGPAADSPSQPTPPPTPPPPPPRPPSLPWSSSGPGAGGSGA